MAKDIFHDTVKLALQKDGWTITHAPYRLRYGIADIYIDLAAEEAIAAQKAGRKIAVEVNLAPCGGSPPLRRLVNPKGQKLCQQFSNL